MLHAGQYVSPSELNLNDPLLEAIRDYWNAHIHDLEIATSRVGSPGFFRELDEYRFDKLRYLPQVVDFSAYQGKRLLEVGCGVGIDLVHFARGGAIVTGVDVADVPIALARKNFEHNCLTADLRVMNGEALQFEDDSFDVVYAYSVTQYTARPQRMVNELHRVLRPGGEAVIMVYHRHSWLSLLSKLARIEMEHLDAPIMRMYSGREFKRLMNPFRNVRISLVRFPVRTRLHHGLRATLYNEVFVRAFRLLPRSLVRPIGAHIMAFASK